MSLHDASEPAKHLNPYSPSSRSQQQPHPQRQALLQQQPTASNPLPLPHHPLLLLPLPAPPPPLPAGEIAASATLTNTSPLLGHLTLTCNGLANLNAPVQSSGLHFPALHAAIHVRFQRHAQTGHVREGRVRRVQSGQVGEAVRVGGVVGVDEQVGRVQLGRVVEDGGFELAELFEDERALLAAWQLDRVDGETGFQGWVVGVAEGLGEEGVEEGGFAGARTPEEVGEEDLALGFGRARFAVRRSFARFGDGEGGGDVVVGRVVAEIGQIGEGGAGGGRTSLWPIERASLGG